MSIHAPHRQLLTVRETAERLNVSEKTVRRLLRSGEIRAVQLGGPRSAIRIDPAELEAWLYDEPRPAA